MGADQSKPCFGKNPWRSRKVPPTQSSIGVQTDPEGQQPQPEPSPGPVHASSIPTEGPSDYEPRPSSTFRPHPDDYHYFYPPQPATQSSNEDNTNNYYPYPPYFITDSYYTPPINELSANYDPLLSQNPPYYPFDARWNYRGYEPEIPKEEESAQKLYQDFFGTQFYYR